ncbi:MAG TPA: DNA-processing protein DprA [Candidatus Saccharimonadales bacterium]|nr:DNA-processing protein DprA [Candidatus Saccharimonadales bacterium]
MSRGKSWFKTATLEDILFVSAIDQIGSISWHKLYKAFSSLAAVLSADKNKLRQIGLTEVMANKLKEPRPNSTRALKAMERYRIKLVTLGEPHYPKLLKEINDPPLWLFYRGDLSATNVPCLTVVGSRKPSPNAYANMENLLPASLVRDICLISGLAYGIDHKTYQLAVKNNGLTVAVLAGGLDDIYPSSHEQLAEEIIDKGGALISEYPPLSRPASHRFPIRNRIIAGLSPATVIVEAAIKSGTLITAKCAIDYNRDVFALPGDINRPTAQGTNFLIKNGAIPLDSAEQLFHYFGLTAQVTRDEEIDSPVWRSLKDSPKTIDEIVAQTKLPIESVMVELTKLELIQKVYQPEIGCYGRK